MTWRVSLRYRVHALMAQLPAGDSPEQKRKALRAWCPAPSWLARVWREEVRRALGLPVRGAKQRAAAGPQLRLPGIEP